MKLTIQERIQDLRNEKGLSLEQLAEQTGLSKSALANYETDDTKDISHYALIRLAKLYGVTTDYLLGLTETKHPSDTDADSLHLSNELMEKLRNGQINTAMLNEMAAHRDFNKLLADMEIYVDGIATRQVQTLNAGISRALDEIISKYHPDEYESHYYLLKALKIQEGEYFSRRVHDDIDSIMADIWEAHSHRRSTREAYSVDDIVKDVHEAARLKDNDEDLMLAVVFKQLGIPLHKVTEQEKAMLSGLMKKSKGMKRYISKRGKRRR